MKKGQAAVEYLVLTGFSMLIIMILMTAAYTRLSATEMQSDIDAAERAVLRLKEAADFAYIHGHPTRLTVSAYFPNNILASQSYISNSTINIAMLTRAGHTDVWASTRADVGWDLGQDPDADSEMPFQEGYYVFIVESTDAGAQGGAINITEQ
jgi:hypothetical protein